MENIFWLYPYKGEREIARIRRSKRCEVRIRLAEYRGKLRIDIRLFVKDNDSHDWKPTPKGVALGVEHLAELTDALLSAEREWRGEPD